MRMKVFLISLGIWLVVLVTCAFMLFGGHGWFGYAMLEPGHVPAWRYIAGLLLPIAAGLALLVGPPALITAFWARKR